MYAHHIYCSKGDQPAEVANPARGQLNRENKFFISSFAPENLVSRQGFGGPVPRQSTHLHTQAESGAYLRESCRVSRRDPFIYFKPPYAIGSVPSLLGHEIAYRWRSLPRVRRHRASKPQGSSERVLPWQVTMDQLICASLSHTNYWYEVGMLKIPASCGCSKPSYTINSVFWFWCTHVAISVSVRTVWRWVSPRYYAVKSEPNYCTIVKSRVDFRRNFPYTVWICVQSEGSDLSTIFLEGGFIHNIKPP